MAYKLNAHIYFARGGDTVDGGVVSSTVKPDIDPTSNWVEFGIVPDFELPQPVEDIMIKGPVAGQIHTLDIVPNPNREFSPSFNVRGVNLFAVESLFGVEKITVETPQIPMLKNSVMKAWLKYQIYNQASQLVMAFDLWGQVVANGPISGGGDSADAFDMPIKHNYIYSALNTVEFQNMGYSK